MLGEVFQALGRDRRQIEEIMLRFAPDELVRGIVAAVRIDELDGVHQVAAVVALVAARLGILADVAGALDIAIGQEAPLALAVKQGLLLFVEVAAR